MAGNAVVESVFSWPGIGNYAITSLMTKDPGPIQSFVLFVAVLYVIVNFVIDIVYGAIDPRIRLNDGRRRPVPVTVPETTVYRAAPGLAASGRNWPSAIALAVIVAMILAALGPWIAPYDADETDPAVALQR